jgi:hypothetical protein
VAKDIEEKPGGEQAGTSENDPLGAGKAAAPRDFFLQDSGETRGAKNPAIVFRNAFAAKETAASRTTRDGFARGVVSTALRN